MRGRALQLTRLLLLLFALSSALYAADTPPAPLPAEAQQAIKKGLFAVEQKDWNLAIRYFGEARKTAPRAPEVLFNLGLSESMIPGRELRSMAWFKAYLSANPAAPNAQAVKEMIDKLEVKVESTMGKLIGQSKQIAGQFPQENERLTAYARIAVEMAKAGDVSGAAQMALMIPSREESGLASIAVALAKAGDIAGAKAIASRMDGEVFKSSAFQDIAIVQAESGDTAGARATLGSSTHYDYKLKGMIAIAKAFYKQGKKDEAYKTLTKAIDLTTQTTPPGWSYYSKDKNQADQQEWKTKGYRTIGEAQAEIGDVRGALRTADLIPQQAMVETININSRGDVSSGGVSFNSQYGDKPKSIIYKALVDSYRSGELKSSEDITLMEEIASKMKGDNEKSNLLSLIGEKRYRAVQARLQASDASGAVGAAGAISDPRYKSNAYEAITKYFLQKGDLASAQAQLDLIQDAGIRTRLYLSLAGKFQSAGDERKARDMLSKARPLAIANKDGYGLRDIAMAQTETGDLDRAMETASMIPDNDNKGDAYAKVARTQLEGDDLSAAKRTVSLMPDDGSRHSRLQDIARKQAETGNIDDAMRIASGIPNETYKNWAFRAIATEQAKKGDFRGALNTAELIKKDADKLGACIAVATAQLNAGYTAAARETIEKAKGIAARMNDPAVQAEAFCNLADAMIRTFHMPAEARDFLASARNAAARIADPGKRSQAYVGGSDLYEGHQRAGMFTDYRQSVWSAVDAAHLIKGSSGDKGSRFGSLSWVQAKSGDLMGARKSADMIADRDRWEDALVAIASAGAGYGNLKAAEETAQRLPSEEKRERVYLAILKAQTEQGNVEAAKQAMARLSNQNRKDDANEAIATACLKAGDIAGAKTAASSLDRDPGYTLFEAMTKAGALDWASRAMVGLKSDYMKNWLYTYIAEAQAKSGDLAGAKKTSRLSIKDGYQLSRVYVAIAKAGDTAWALESAAGIKNSEYRFQAYKGIAEVMAEKGDTAGARGVLATIKKGELTIDRVRGVAGVQAKMGDMPAAMEMLATIHPKDAEFESWAGYEIASRLPENQWREVGAAIKEGYWKSRLFSEKAQSLEDRAAAREAAGAIPNAFEKSLACLALARKDIKSGNLSGALDLAGLIPDEECRMLALSEILFSGINRGNLTPILPKIQQLPDSAGKTYILLDGTAALVDAGSPKAATPLLAAAEMSAGKMADSFWKARAYREIGRIASAAQEQAISSNAGRLAETVAGRTKEDEKALWANYVNQPGPPDLEKIKADEARMKQIEKWTRFIDSDLSKPLFMDIQGYIQSLTSKVKPWDIFNGITGAVDDTAAMFKKMKQLESEK